MIKLDISGVHFQLDPKIKKYTRKRLGRLDRYMPHQAGSATSAEVILSDQPGAATERFSCELILNVPKQKLVAKQSTPNNIYAAIDLVEDKAKAQLLKYKSRYKKVQEGKTRRVLRRLKRFGRP